jgi:hypothetical protein
MARRFFLAILLLGLGLAPWARADDVHRTLQAELSGADLADFGVENLVGRMRISAGTGDRITVVARVVAESADLADAVRLERVAGDGSRVTLRVRYPFETVKVFEYVDPDHDRQWPFDGISSSSGYDYDGHHVRVHQGRGTRLWADLDVQVPAGRRQAFFRNLVGRIEADGLAGTLRFEVGSADLRLRRLDGQVSVEGDSGDIQARDLKGSFTSDSSSGDCRMDDFDGQQFRFHASSGDLVARGVRARLVETETSSGDVTLSSADIEEFEAEAASGDVAVDLDGGRLASFRVTTSSGDVTLGLPSNAAFEAEADQSSGDMRVDFPGGVSVHDDDTLVAYRHGRGGAKIRVTTSSGDFSITPR